MGALKERGVSRKHRCFTSCYKRLFNLSKSFLKVSPSLLSCVSCQEQLLLNCLHRNTIKVKNIKKDNLHCNMLYCFVNLHNCVLALLCVICE